MHYENLDVIVLTYNRADYLKIALESLCESNATWRKIIVLDNASTDHTIDVVEKIIDKYPSRTIEIITNEKNLGNPGNFKKSQAIATNEYTAIFHDDDAIHPEYIDRAMSLMMDDKNEKRPVMVSGGVRGLYNVNHENWDILPDTYFYFPSNFNMWLQLIINRPTFCCAIYNTKIYKSVPYCPEKYGKLHDVVFMSEIGMNGDLIFLHGECVRWRQHVKSDSNTLKTGPFPDEILNIILRLKEMALSQQMVDFDEK